MFLLPGIQLANNEKQFVHGSSAVPTTYFWVCLLVSSHGDERWWRFISVALILSLFDRVISYLSQLWPTYLKAEFRLRDDIPFINSPHADNLTTKLRKIIAIFQGVSGLVVYMDPITTWRTALQKSRCTEYKKLCLLWAPSCTTVFVGAHHRNLSKPDESSIYSQTLFPYLMPFSLNICIHFRFSS